MEIGFNELTWAGLHQDGKQMVAVSRDIKMASVVLRYTSYQHIQMSHVFIPIGMVYFT
jgi:hypothetical protein